MHFNRNYQREMKQVLRFILFTIFVIGFIACGGEKKKDKTEIQSTGNDLVDQLTVQLEKDSNNVGLLYQRANVLYESEEYEAAISDLEKALTIDSLDPKLYHLLSDTYLDYYRSREALNMMEKAARLHPERIPTLLKLSETQMILNQFENSVFTCNEILRLSPQNEEAFFMLGMNFREMGMIDKAINSFQTAVEMNPEMVDAWMILADLHEKQGNKDALKYYNNALTVAPESEEVLHAKAFYLQNHDDIEGALKIYKKINTINPQYQDAYLNAGILRIEQDSFEQAFEQFNILAGINPQNHLAFYYRGLIHKGYGNYEAAKIDFQNTINLNSNFERAQKELEEVLELMPKEEG